MAKTAHEIYFLCLSVLLSLCIFHCNAQAGPDPWNYEENDIFTKVEDEKNIPPDLRLYPKKEQKPVFTDSVHGIAEWFYRRILSIVLRGGQVKKNEDGSVDISLQMKFNVKEWDTLDQYLQSNAALSEDKLRRSLGYIEQSIYEPSMPTRIILAWSDYLQMLLSEYKTEITLCCGLLALCLFLFWLKKHMSHRNAMMVILVTLYCYEVFVSYKEVEQKEVETFVKAVNSCQWYFWSSKCELPKPDPLIFFKHMNPVKIGVRMFTNIVSEPMIMLSETVKTMTRGISDELWYPFNAILYSFLIIFFNILLIFFLIMILFNFILNIPFQFSVIGLLNVALKQRKRNVFNEPEDHSENENVQNTNKPVQNANQAVQNTNAISGQTLDKLLDLFSKALNNNRNNGADSAAIQDFDVNPRIQITNCSNTKGLKRSASTGRLPNLSAVEVNTNMKITKRNVGFRVDGSGDAR